MQATSGFDPRDVSPHLLGVENVYKLVGPVVAVTSFLLDIFKGLTAVMLGTLVAAWAVGFAPWALDPLAGIVITLPGGFGGFFSGAANVK